LTVDTHGHHVTTKTTTTTSEGMIDAAPPPIPNEVHGATYNKTFGRICLLLAVLLLVVGGLTKVDVTKDDDVRADEAANAMIADFDGTKPIYGLPKMEIGPIDLSITKPVLYMWLAALLCVGFATWQAKRMEPKPNRRQTFVETMYEFLHDQIAKSTLTPKIFNRYMPYLASIFLFIWVMNLISFLPLPLAGHSFLEEQGGPGIKDLGLYAATSNINVTLALTIATLAIVHVLGVREHGARGYLATWKPEGHWFLQGFMWFIHAIGELVKFISLSVRLFANMLTGHMLVLVMFTIIFVVGTPLVGIATVPVAIIFFLFEVVLVATLQAYIFAVLSGTYMGMATSHDH
jgi:F-type H+-transporting ATPase subunit a